VKTSRLLAVSAISVAMALSLTGCFGNILGGVSTGGTTGGNPQDGLNVAVLVSINSDLGAATMWERSPVRPWT